MDTLAAVPLAGLTAPALLLLAVWMILSGKIVPRSTHMDTIAERNDWRDAHRISETARAEMAHQIEELLEHARTTDALIRALPKIKAET